MLKTIGSRAEPVSYTQAAGLPRTQETPAPANPTSITQRAFTLAWLLWGELTGNKRIFPG